MEKLFLFAFFAVIIIATMIAVPIALIWSINTLFATNIAYNLSTWFASFAILVLFGNKSGVSITRKETQKCCKSKND